jgi:hypothetical protein
MDRSLPDWFTEKMQWYAYYGSAWTAVWYALGVTGVVAPVIAWLQSNRTAPQIPGSQSSGAATGAPLAPTSPTSPPTGGSPGANDVAAGRFRLFKTVGFWSAVAAICTGLNALFGAGSKAESAWNAYDYLNLAKIDYVLKDSKLTEEYLREAVRKSYEIFTRKQSPPSESKAEPTQKGSIP